MIFAESKCTICNSAELHTATRCKRCSEQRDSAGKPFIVYCEVWYFIRRMQSVAIQVYAAHTAHSYFDRPANEPISSFQLWMESQGWEIAHIVEPGDVIHEDLLNRQSDE